jgi:hypothetical protein
MLWFSKYFRQKIVGFESKRFYLCVKKDHDNDFRENTKMFAENLQEPQKIW